jgi:hypothetical protein
VCDLFLQVGTQNLQTGDEVMVDPSHSDQAITGIQLTPEQEDVLVIIGGEQMGQTGVGLGVQGLLRLQQQYQECGGMAQLQSARQHYCPSGTAILSCVVLVDALLSFLLCHHSLAAVCVWSCVYRRAV